MLRASKPSARLFLMRKQFRVGSRLSWIVAWLLALIAPAMYLLWPSTAMWWVGLVLLVPIVALAAWREDQKGYGSYHGPGDGGPWGPPPL
jgi:hypothetical protein